MEYFLKLESMFESGGFYCTILSLFALLNYGIVLRRVGIVKTVVLFCHTLYWVGAPLHQPAFLFGSGIVIALVSCACSPVCIYHAHVYKHTCTHILLQLDDRPIQHREVMNNESELFKSYFDEIQLLEGG